MGDWGVGGWWVVDDGWLRCERMVGSGWVGGWSPIIICPYLLKLCHG